MFWRIDIEQGIKGNQLFRRTIIALQIWLIFLICSGVNFIEIRFAILHRNSNGNFCLAFRKAELVLTRT